MSSTSATPSRRKPQQARAARRRVTFLDVAARLIGEQGYESVTMTAIAEAAHASIGTLYDYFPDKQSLAQALAFQYAGEIDEHWKRLLANPAIRSKSALADSIVEGALTFAAERPAYLPLFGAPIIYARSPAARLPLRQAFADALRKLNPNLTPNRAFLSAVLLVELIKSLLSVTKQVDPGQRGQVTQEFKELLKFHLSQVIG